MVCPVCRTAVHQEQDRRNSHKIPMCNGSAAQSVACALSTVDAAGNALNPSTPLMDAGLDSLDMLKLAALLSGGLGQLGGL